MASDFAPESLIADLRLACGLMTRIPAGRPQALAAAAADPGARARASRAYPLAGLAVGVIGGAVYWLCMDLSLPPLVAALAAAVIMAIVFHYVFTHLFVIDL